MAHDEKAARFVFLIALIGGGTLFLIAAYALLIRGLFGGIYLAGASLVYITFGTAGLRGRVRLESAWRLIAGVGAALAVIESTNIVLEQFFSLPQPADAIVPASAMGAMILAAAIAAVTVSSSAGVAEGIIASVFSVGTGMLLSSAVGLTLIFVSGSDLSQGMSNATMHLVLPLIVAAAVATLAAVALKAVHTNTRALFLFSTAGSIILVFGIRLLVKAASLPRPERPAFVLPGMLLSALGLTLLPSFLGYFQNFHQGPLPASGDP